MVSAGARRPPPFSLFGRPFWTVAASVPAEARPVWRAKVGLPSSGAECPAYTACPVVVEVGGGSGGRRRPAAVVVAGKAVWLRPAAANRAGQKAVPGQGAGVAPAAVAPNAPARLADAVMAAVADAAADVAANMAEQQVAAAVAAVALLPALLAVVAVGRQPARSGHKALGDGRTPLLGAADRRDPAPPPSYLRQTFRPAGKSLPETQKGG